MGWAPALREAWMDEIEALEKWMALFSADPDGVSDPTTIEVEGGVYARQVGLWTRTGATSLTLNSGLRWLNLPPGAVVAAVGAFDDAFGSVFLFGDLLPEVESYPSGGVFTLPAGEYELRID